MKLSFFTNIRIGLVISPESTFSLRVKAAGIVITDISATAFKQSRSYFLRIIYRYKGHQFFKQRILWRKDLCIDQTKLIRDLFVDPVLHIIQVGMTGINGRTGSTKRSRINLV